MTASKSSTRLTGGDGNDTLNVNASSTLAFPRARGRHGERERGKAVVYGGPGTNTINLGSTSQDSIVLQQGGWTRSSGSTCTTAISSTLPQVLAESQLSYVASDFLVSASGSDATLSFNPNGASLSAPGSALAVLHGVGPGVTLDTLLSDNVLKIA